MRMILIRMYDTCDTHDIHMVRVCAEYSDLCNIPDHYNGITNLPDIKVIYFLFSCADAEDSSSSETDDDGGGGAPSAPPPPSQPSRASPRPDSPGHGHPDEHADENADENLPYMSDDGPEYECEGLGTMSSHLAKLDSLSARGCADKFFQVHTARWGKSMPRPGDLLHSARAGGEDVREGRKRRAENITRIAAESHAFCTSSNLSQRRSDSVLETFTNVSTFKFKFKLCLKFWLHVLCILVMMIFT